MPYTLTSDFKELYNFIPTPSCPEFNLNPLYSELNWHLLKQEWRYYFSRFAASEFSGENILALMLVGQYRNRPTLEKAQALQEVFFDDTAAFQVNIPNRMFTAIKNELKQGKAPRELFDDTLAVLIANLSDTWMRYEPNFLLPRLDPKSPKLAERIKATFTKTSFHRAPDKVKIEQGKGKDGKPLVGKPELDDQQRKGLKKILDAGFLTASLFLVDMYSK